MSRWVQGVFVNLMVEETLRVSHLKPRFIESHNPASAPVTRYVCLSDRLEVGWGSVSDLTNFLETQAIQTAAVTGLYPETLVEIVT